MKKGSHFIFILILLSSIKLFSQVPGYMGKRFTIGYSNNFFPSFIGPTANSYDAGLNSTHSFNVEYTIKNRTNLCLSYQMLNTGVSTNHTFVQSTTDMYGNVYISEYSYDPVPNVPMKLHSNNACIGFKFFSSGTLAPVGKYKKLELVLLFSNLTYGSEDFLGLDYNSGTGNYGDPVRKSLGKGDYSYKTFALTYSFGRQRVFFNRLVFDYGMQFGMLPAGLFANLNSEGDFTSLNSFEDVFRNETNRRLFRYQLVNFHMGIGFLAF